MSDKTFPVSAEFAANANINKAQYEAMYARSIDDPEGFWAEQANKYVSWYKPWTKTLDWSFDRKIYISIGLPMQS